MFKRSAFVAVLTGACVIGAGSALAFQETGPRTSPGSAPKLSAPEMTFDVPGKEGPQAGRRDKSGFRSLDVLPKSLNFGLELLYGSSIPDKSTGHNLDDLLTDDMTIRGTIKRRF